MNPREFAARCWQDTGFLCRELLGYNYDEDGPGGNRTNVGNGGIYRTGSHQQMVEILDSGTRFKMIQAPRGSRKSTLAVGFCCKHILFNPDVRVMYFARTEEMVRGKAEAVKKELLSQRVVDVFGPQVDREADPRHFTVFGRRAHGLQNATFEAYSMDSMPTGGRADVIVLDDFIDSSNCTNKEQLKKSKDKYGEVQPFLANGAILLILGTRWDPDDLYDELERSPLFHPPYGESLILGAGVQVVRKDGGALDLEEDASGLTFPFLTLDFLRTKLHGMAQKGEYEMFCRQYLNQVTIGATGAFKRNYFRPLVWADDMHTLSGYLLTDTAISEAEEGSQSVVAYVALDASDNIYVLDLRLGNWQMPEFVEQYFDVLEQWQQRVNHCGEVWESIALASSYRSAIEADARSRRTRVRTIEINRYTGERKDMRILSLCWPMSQKRFFVVNTVPRTFEGLSGPQELWNPHGHLDPRTKLRQPSGELVDQFIRFKRGKGKGAGKKDVADAIAMILEEQKLPNGNTRRYCKYRPWQPKPQPTSLTEQRIDRYRAEESHSSASDWWEKTLHEHGL